MHKRILVIDNYDSFTYILANYLAEISQTKPRIALNDEITLTEIKEFNPTHIIISPGPGTPTNPQDIGITSDVINHLSNHIPILGICLGHQAIIHHFGGTIEHAPTIRHGKTSQIQTIPTNLQSSSLFTDIPKQLEVMRYHSLIGTNLPDPLTITAKTKEDNLTMAIQHKELPLYGIQFHPESFGTEYGKTIIHNFLTVKTPLKP